MVFNKKITIYLILCLTLFLGFFFEENSSGGAKIDYEYLSPFIKNFTLDFSSGLETFLNNSASLIHSPVFYILMSLFLRIFGDLSILKVMYLIVDKAINYLEGQLAEKNITIRLTNLARDYLAKNGYEKKFGARPLERLVQKTIKEPLADEILFGKLKKGGHVDVDVLKEEIIFKI